MWSAAGFCLGAASFFIYINDIPVEENKHKSFSTLYADDLGVFFTFKKLGNVEKSINNYLQKLVQWLYKWRLNMNTKMRLGSLNHGHKYHA